MPIGITIGLKNNPNCYHTDLPEITPVRTADFVGSLKQGGTVNHMKIKLAPHGNGTHTECSGHIYDNNLTIEEALRISHIPAQVISLTPEQISGQRAITAAQINGLKLNGRARALIIRSLPNDEQKLIRNYSGTNPPYIAADAMQKIVEAKIEHLVVDLPSVDPETDGGKLLAHKMFWSGEDRENHCTITELAYVPNKVKDGLYLLNLQVLRIELDASPANPVLFALKTI